MGGDTMRDAQADVPSTKRLWAQLAFKNSMVHGILQFTPSIAFCYVLHRCVSRDIRCRESFFIIKLTRPMCVPRTEQHELRTFLVLISLAHVVPGFVYDRRTFKRPCKRNLECTSADTKDHSISQSPMISDYKYMFACHSAMQGSTMILPQVHLRKPCYDFSFL